MDNDHFDALSVKHKLPYCVGDVIEDYDGIVFNVKDGVVFIVKTIDVFTMHNMRCSPLVAVFVAESDCGETISMLYQIEPERGFCSLTS